MSDMTLGDAVDLVSGPGWGCACTGPWPGRAPGDLRCACQRVMDEARELRRAAHITVKLVATLRDCVDGP